MIRNNKEIIDNNINLEIKDLSDIDNFTSTIRLTFFDENDKIITSNILQKDEFVYTPHKTININFSLHVSRLSNDILPINHKYKLIISFYDNIYDNIFIKEISASKTEIKIGMKNNNIDKKWIEWCYYPERLLNSFQNMIYIGNEKFRIINVLPDYSEYKKIIKNNQIKIEELEKLLLVYSSQGKNDTEIQKQINDLKIEMDSNILLDRVTFIIKLSKNIVEDIKIPYNDCFIVQETGVDRIYDDIYIYSDKNRKPELRIISSTPDIKYTNTTSWNNWMNLTSNKSASLLSNLSESKELGIRDLNIDFSSFSNHVYFGNATEKFKNAALKIQKIQVYNDLLKTQTTPDSITTSQSYSNLINEILNGMTQYERYMYNNSSSYAWPKYLSGSCYINYSYTSSEYKEWYNNWLSISENYDKNNHNALINLIPENIYIEDKNGYFTAIIYTWGEFFDCIKSYIDQIRYLYNFDYDKINSVPDDLLSVYAMNYNWELIEGYDIEELSPYLLGTMSSIPLKQITLEKWRRFLSSIPYLNKIKGTRRAIDAIMNIYGIPTSILSIKEYGGTNLTGSDYVEDETNIYCLNFTGNEVLFTPNIVFSIISSSNFTYETRYSTISSSNMVLFGNSGFNVSIETSSILNTYGRLVCYINNIPVITISGSNDNLLIYDGEWSNVILQRINDELKLTLKRYKENQLYYNTTYSYTLSGSDILYINTSSLSDSKIYIGGDSNTGSFIGLMQEFRLWKCVLSESELDNHAYDFESIAVSNPFDIKDNLVVHYKLTDNKNLSSSQFVNDFAPLPKYDASASYFSGNQFKNITLSTKTYFEKINLSGYSSNKISIGPISESISSNSNRIDLIFSPSQEINWDILKEFAMFDFNDSIGNPYDMYSDSYNNLDNWKFYYFKKLYGNYNIYSYLKFIENFDKSVFNLVKQVIPERTNLFSGLLIEPHILERSKFRWKKNAIDNLTYDSDIKLESKLGITSSFGVFDSSQIKVNDNIIYFADNLNYNGEFSFHNTGSFSTEIEILEGKIAIPKETNIIVWPEMPLYNPISQATTGSAYISTYKQLKYATSRGTQNTTETDYAGAPWEVSQSAATIIRVV